MGESIRTLGLLEGKPCGHFLILERLILKLRFTKGSLWALYEYWVDPPEGTSALGGPLPLVVEEVPTFISLL